MLRKRSLLFLTIFLVSCLFFFAATEEGYSGAIPVDINCCQLAEGGCFNYPEGEIVFCDGEVIESAICDEPDGLCIGQISPISSPIPTLSEWGLIAMAGILGIVGYIIIRRRRVSA